MEKHSVSFLQDFKNGASNSYFVKIIEKQEKGVYIGCNMYVTEFVLGRFSKRFQASAVGKVFQHTEKKFYLSVIGLLQKKTSRVVKEMPL